MKKHEKTINDLLRRFRFINGETGNGFVHAPDNARRSSLRSILSRAGELTLRKRFVLTLYFGFQRFGKRISFSTAKKTAGVLIAVASASLAIMISNAGYRISGADRLSASIASGSGTSVIHLGDSLIHADRNTPIPENGIIASGHDSSVSITVGSDNHINIGPDATMKIIRMRKGITGKSDIECAIFSRSLRADIRNLGGGKIIFTAGFSRTEVKGTVLRITRYTDRDIIFVNTGYVIVSSIDNPDNTISIRSGQSAEVRKGKPVLIIPAGDTINADQAVTAEPHNDTEESTNTPPPSSVTQEKLVKYDTAGIKVDSIAVLQFTGSQSTRNSRIAFESLLATSLKLNFGADRVKTQQENTGESLTVTGSIDNIGGSDILSIKVVDAKESRILLSKSITLQRGIPFEMVVNNFTEEITAKLHQSRE
ncbi:MAG TPA: hypothetical protein PKK43_00815 [Spirochaetota bacterium]|nr:hypothetical protein [Spirochaetota bacterium]